MPSFVTTIERQAISETITETPAVKPTPAKTKSSLIAFLLIDAEKISLVNNDYLLKILTLA